jgi:transglutaminase-like putative cysteine protease
MRKSQGKAFSDQRSAGGRSGVMRRAGAWAGALLTLACAGVAHASSNPNLPDWVMQAAAETGSWGDAKAAILLNDTLLTVGPDGKAVERTRMVVKILRPQGRRAATPFAEFSKDLKLLSFHVWSIGPDGHHYTMKDNEYVEVGENDPGMVYLDNLAKKADPPGADPGGIVAWETVQQLPSYETEDEWMFQDSIPVVQTSYEIDLPAGWHQRAVWFKHDPVQPTEATPGHFLWQLTNLSAVNLEDVPLHPAWQALAARMSVHFSADEIPDGDALWAKIGGWYYNLEAPQSEGATDLATAARAAAGDGDFMAKLSNIADFMQQQIRYVGVEIGIGGRQAHPAEEVFQKRYGDCKDKATLLVAMLDAVGIRATWVAVDDRRGVMDPGTPSELGNHMIAAIEIPKGYDNPRLQAVVTAKTGKRYLIFDPTNPYVPVGQMPNYEQGGYGLLLAGADSQVIGFPVLDPDLAKTERTAKFDLAADGTLKGNVTVQRYGTSAWVLRDELAMSSDKEQRELIEKSLQQDLSTFTLDTEKTENVKQLDQPLEMQYSVTAPLYAKSAGNLLLVRPRVVGTVAQALDDKPRKVPISFDGVGSWQDTFDVKLPAGYTVDDVPDPVNLDVGFATYHSEVKAQGDTLHYTRQYVLKKVVLDPGEYVALRKLEGQITSDENSNAVLKKQ